FTPKSLSGLVSWFDSTKITGLSDRAAISTWLDQSAMSNNLSGSGASRPIYKTNIQNGLPVVRADGIASKLDYAANPLNGQPFSLFMVLNYSNGFGTGDYHAFAVVANTFFVGLNVGAWLVYENAEVISTRAVGVPFWQLSVVARNFSDIDLVTNGTVEN